MSVTTTKKTISMKRLLPVFSLAVLLSIAAHAAAPGVQGTNFSMTASAAYISQPDGQSVYSWGYACSGGGTAAPSTIAAPAAGVCGGIMQIPGPTLIVTENVAFSITLTNNLPTAAGNTSLLFPGLTLQSTAGGASGLLTQEAAPGGSVTYNLVATSPGTRAYYSGTQSDLQIEMGLYGAIIVLPASVPAVCTNGLPVTNPGGNAAAQGTWGESDFRLAASAYDHPDTCYDREYLFQFSEMDPNIHNQALAQVAAAGACTAGRPACSLNVPTEPYHPAYFMINGRSMPDDMDSNYAAQYPHQPYNGNPHMHPGELVLLRIIGQGRWQHPFHEHGNHVRILGRDGNLILSGGTALNYPAGGTSTVSAPGLAGPLLFTTTTTPGLAMDGIFYWSGKGLNWDAYGHNPASIAAGTAPVHATCTPDANGYNTSATAAINYFEWCQDHNKPLQVHPFGDVAAGGPVTLPDPNLFTNGAWFGGSPYLGPDATVRAVGPTGTTPPSGTIANPPTSEAGFAFMWHSHNEREITTNNIFPGGMLMMMLVDSREFVIDESN